MITLPVDGPSAALHADVVGRGSGNQNVRVRIQRQQLSIVLQQYQRFSHRFASNRAVRGTAEGVETPAQLASLQDLHCGEGQGYLFQRPGNADAFADLLEAGIAQEIVFN